MWTDEHLFIPTHLFKNTHKNPESDFESSATIGSTDRRPVRSFMSEHQQNWWTSACWSVTVRFVLIMLIHAHLLFMLAFSWMLCYDVMVLISAQTLIVSVIICWSLCPAGSPGRALNSTCWDVSGNKSHRCCRCLKVGEVGGGWGARGHRGVDEGYYVDDIWSVEEDQRWRTQLTESIYMTALLGSSVTDGVVWSARQQTTLLRVTSTFTGKLCFRWI